jgi:hypothetical protein
MISWKRIMSAIETGIDAVQILQPILGAGVAMTITTLLYTTVSNFNQAPWYIQIGPGVLAFGIVWLILWYWFPFLIKRRLKKLGILKTRESGGSFWEELAEADRVWAFWYNGGDARNRRIFEQLKRPNRLVLLDNTDNTLLDYHIGLYGGKRDTLHNAIRDTAIDAANAGIEVKLWPHPMPFTMTIFDPESLNGRIQVEFQIPGAPLNQSPSVIVHRRTDAQIFLNLLEFFKRAIGDK